jgi:hypothetical protein
MVDGRGVDRGVDDLWMKTQGSLKVEDVPIEHTCLFVCLLALKG